MRGRPCPIFSLAIRSQNAWLLGDENGPCFFLEFLIRLIQVHGPWIISVVVALECAGVPLPERRSLLLLLFWLLPIDIAVVEISAAAGAIVGDGIGYTVGRRFGIPLLRKYGRYIHLDENRLRSISVFSVWERCRIFWSLYRGATNVRGFACWRK
jgi:hypothetical protein